MKRASVPKGDRRRFTALAIYGVCLFLLLTLWRFPYEGLIWRAISDLGQEHHVRLSCEELRFHFPCRVVFSELAVEPPGLASLVSTHFNRLEVRAGVISLLRKQPHIEFNAEIGERGRSGGEYEATGTLLVDNAQFFIENCRIMGKELDVELEGKLQQETSELDLKLAIHKLTEGTPVSPIDKIKTFLSTLPKPDSRRQEAEESVRYHITGSLWNPQIEVEEPVKPAKPDNNA